MFRLDHLVNTFLHCISVHCYNLQMYNTVSFFSLSDQIFSYLIVIDFESTCWREKNNCSQEISK